MSPRCPGQDGRNLGAEVISCGNCHEAVEFFSDEIRRYCPRCQSVIYRERAFSCLEWCSYGESCVGKESYSRYFDGR
ncbi:MAG: phosphohydrolase [Candidatus Omnitrophota bacterium]